MDSPSEAVLERVSDAFFALDTDWRFTYLNDQAEELLDRDRDDLLGESVWETFEPAVGTTFYDEYHEAMAEQEPTSFVEYYEPLSTWFEVSAYPSETGLSVYFRDVSERKDREQELRRRARQFESFGDVLAHDLQSPLNAVDGRLELAMETGDIEHVEVADDILDRVYGLVGHLADVMREGRLVDDPELVAFEPCLRSAWASIETQDGTLRVESTEPIVADESALRRFLDNLFRNAVEHGGDDVTVWAGVTDDGFYVADDGPGIPEEHRDRVLEPGYTTKEEGSGFGTASANQIALAHGWDVSVGESRDGGARFEVTGVSLGAGS